jgi:hypothetical protein
MPCMQCLSSDMLQSAVTRCKSIHCYLMRTEPAKPSAILNVAPTWRWWPTKKHPYMQPVQSVHQVLCTATTIPNLCMSVLQALLYRLQS